MGKIMDTINSGRLEAMEDDVMFHAMYLAGKAYLGAAATFSTVSKVISGVKQALGPEVPSYTDMEPGLYE